MIKTDRYISLITIKIDHDYYGNHILPLDLIPDKESKQLLDKCSVIIKRLLNTWSFYVDEKWLSYFRNAGNIKFELRPEEDVFYYVTQINNTTCMNCSLQSMEGTMNYEVNIDSESEEVKLGFDSPCRFLEFIVLTQHSSFQQLAMTSKNFTNKVEFEPGKKLLWDNSHEAIQFRSTHQMKLSKGIDYHFALVDVTDYGAHILLQNISSPDPRNRSIYDPHSTITAYYTL